MTEHELQILRHLYINPVETNFTKSVLNSSLGLDQNILEDNLQALINNRYVERVYTENQKALNDPCYRITGFGAKKINEIDNIKSIEGVIKKYAQRLVLLGLIIGGFGVMAQIVFGTIEAFYKVKQLEIQRQQFQIQPPTPSLHSTRTICHPDKRTQPNDSLNNYKPD